MSGAAALRRELRRGDRRRLVATLRLADVVGDERLELAVAREAALDEERSAAPACRLVGHADDAVDALALYMGHASVMVTFDLYGHLMPGNEAEAAELLDAFPSASPAGVSSYATGLPGCRGQRLLSARG